MDQLAEGSSAVAASSGHGDSFLLLETHEQNFSNICAKLPIRLITSSIERSGRQFFPSLLTALPSSFDPSLAGDPAFTKSASVSVPVSSMASSPSSMASVSTISPPLQASDVAFNSSSLAGVPTSTSSFPARSFPAYTPSLLASGSDFATSTLAIVSAIRSPPLLASGLAFNSSSTASGPALISSSMAKVSAIIPTLPATGPAFNTSSSASLPLFTPSLPAACHAVALPNIGGLDTSISWRRSALSSDRLDPSSNILPTGTKTLLHSAEIYQESSSLAKGPTGNFALNPVQERTLSPVQGPTPSSFQGSTLSPVQEPTNSFAQGPTLSSVQGPTLSSVHSAQGPTCSFAQGPTPSPVQVSIGSPSPQVSISSPTPQVSIDTPTQAFAFKDLDCLENLPEVVESLSQAQRQQAAEIERQYQLLQEEKERLKKEEDQLQQIQEELGRCTRQICLAEEDGAVLSQHCKKFKMDLDSVSLESLEIVRKIQELRQKMADDARLYADYRVKMSSHQQLVDDLESSMPTHMELARQKEKIQVLQAEKTAMENELLVTTDGSTTKLEQEMKSLIASRDKLLTSISEKTTAIANEESRHACLKQDTDVLRKRNQAQLTRLRRQLKEAQLRNKQWHDEACQLENQIEQLRKFTEE